MLVGVLSDTHLPKRGKKLPVAIVRALEKVDMIIHAGDFTSLSVLVKLQALAPVKAVYGNVDSEEIRSTLNAAEQFCLEGLTIGLIHGDGGKGTTKSRALAAFPLAQCIVYGHSHIPEIDIIENKMLFNPGSPSDKRFNPFPTYGLLSINPGILAAEILDVTDNKVLKHISFMFGKNELI